LSCTAVCSGLHAAHLGWLEGLWSDAVNKAILKSTHITKRSIIKLIKYSINTKTVDDESNALP